MLRLATEADIASIDRCNRRNLPENYPAFFYRHFLHSSSALTMVIDNENNGGQSDICAYVMMQLQRDAHGRPIGHVYSLAVDAAHRRKGYARQLLRAAEQRFAALFPSVQHLTLHVRKKNKAAIALYQSENFWRVKIVKRYYEHPTEDALVMRKTVADSIIGMKTQPMTL